jgi:FSR family fosmidomycin resistance protein-like MFS transporter
MSTVAIPPARREIEVISLVGFAHGVSHFFHLMIPPLFPWLMPEFGLSFTEAGAMTAVFFIVSSIGQASSGFIVDRIGARRVLLAGLAVFAMSAFILATAQNYATLLLVAALSGLGNSVFHPADYTLLNRNVSRSRIGHAFSVHGLSGSLGWALAPVFMTGITLAFNWRVAATAAITIAIVPFVLVLLRRETMTESRIAKEHETPAGADASLFAFLSSTAVWMCFLFFFFTMIAFGVLQNFAPSAFRELYGLSLSASASSLTVFMLGSAAGVAVGGFLVAKGDAHEKYIAMILVTAALLALSIASGAVPVWSVVVLMAGLGLCNGLTGPSRDMLVRRAATARFGHSAFGRVYGFVYSGLDVGLATSPFIFGPLMDAGYFNWVLGGVAVAQTCAVFVALNVGRHASANDALGATR